MREKTEGVTQQPTSDEQRLRFERTRDPSPVPGSEARASLGEQGVDVDAGPLVVQSERSADAATRVDPDDDRPEAGSWWWVSEAGPGELDIEQESDGLDEDDDDGGEDEDEDDGDEGEGTRKVGEPWLACVVEVGSNYARLRGVEQSVRVALDDFHGRCTVEPHPEAVIAQKVGGHRVRVRELMGEIRAVCHRLGVPLRQALSAEDSASQALAVVHGVSDAQRHKALLIQAKDDLLPELFRLVKAEHGQMAKWMSAELLPAQAELAAAEEVTEVIAGKIHTFELYAGLQEVLERVRDGAPAGVDERVRLMQRMHYMDEECLARYEAGGMDFEDVAAFDAWLSRDENFGRIFPSRRCVVAFRVRRGDKEYPGLDAWIRFQLNEANRQTFLYVRNGDQLWRLQTSVDFGAELFPSRESSDLLGDDELWVKSDEYDIKRDQGLITGQRRAAMIQEHQDLRDYLAQKLWQWHRAGKPEKDWMYTAVGGRYDYGREPGETYRQTGKPHYWAHEYRRSRAPHLEYELLTPRHIYHDDAMRRVQRAALEHNRVAVIVQGLLDRSTCLHPHPPWRIWTPEGFAAGVELVYDVSRAITTGEAPDFEEYRRQLNRSLRAGCHTIGQKRAWSGHMEEKYGDRWRIHARHGRGPGLIHRVERVLRDGSCEFRWTRERVKPKWVPDGPGFVKASYPEIEVGWICPASELTCVDAYTPGDFRLFFDDPRTRALYLRWAPILLACEDWHHRRREALAAATTGSSVGVVRPDESALEEDIDDMQSTEAGG